MDINCSTYKAQGKHSLNIYALKTYVWVLVGYRKLTSLIFGSSVYTFGLYKLYLPILFLYHCYQHSQVGQWFPNKMASHPLGKLGTNQLIFESCYHLLLGWCTMYSVWSRKRITLHRKRPVYRPHSYKYIPKL